MKYDIPIPDSNYQALAQAIVTQAIKDYIDAQVRQKKAKEKNEDSFVSKKMITDCERFFRSGWFQTLTGGLVNPEEVIKVNKVRGEYAYWKYLKKCKRCKNENCIHFRDERFTQSWICEKEN